MQLFFELVYTGGQTILASIAKKKEGQLFGKI